MSKLTVTERQNVKLLTEIYKKHNATAFNLALTAIWENGINHFTEKVINANIAYRKELADKAKGVPIISPEIKIEAFEIIREIKGGNFTIWDILNFVQKAKVY